MFGFNKKKRLIEGPVEFTAEVEIDRSAADVFPLIDLGDPRFSHAQLGADVRCVDGHTDRFDMTLEAMGDAVFKFIVLERVEGARQAIECWMEPQLYALEKAVETRIIEPVGEASCRVKLTTLATFSPELSDEEVADEIAMMSQAVTGDLEKLKVLAEDGLEALQALEDAAMEFNVEFDLGELDIDWDDIEPQQ